MFVLPNEDLSSLNGMPLDVVKGNVLDRCAVRAAVEGVEIVYHLAGIISIMPGRDEAMRQVNVVGTGNVARISREAGVRRMVYVSSIHALARPAKGTAIDEKVLFDPHSAAGEYDQTKAEASLEVLAETGKGLDAVLVCPTGIIGPYLLPRGLTHEQPGADVDEAGVARGDQWPLRLCRCPRRCARHHPRGCPRHKRTDIHPPW